MGMSREDAIEEAITYALNHPDHGDGVAVIRVCQSRPRCKLEADEALTAMNNDCPLCTVITVKNGVVTTKEPTAQ